MELLVVITIIGILATVALVSLNSARIKARDTRRLADVRQIALALEFCYNDINKYISTTAFPAPGQSLTCGGTNFITAMPANPTGGAYIYGVDNDANPQKYVLGVLLESGNSALLTDSDNTIYGVNCADNVYCIAP